MAAARLTALRLVGFKSFAERTTVEFGPGISAVVGPNGSGKSNLADALRWTLGEQGRMLRTRRSEDVIFAGSSSRRAIGMADVTLVIDNGDRLLPVDYGEVEIGRRLYRSGESEYLLNRQRIRLRDLVELLDAGNLADNAFLFIGQGMVDQALALRPEERRPLFEEAAGVRRHERRRRQAEAELVEAGKNLDRLRDVLAELRPQAKRLAAQADQLQARRTAGMELAEGLLAAARARWIGASVAAAKEQADVGRARAAADAALAALKAAEDEAAALSEAIAHRAEAERGQRESLDRQRGGLTDLRIASARVESELAAASRDADRLAGERKTLESRLSESARVLAAPEPAQAAVGDDELELVERQLDDLERQAVPGDAGRDLVLRTQELDQQERRRDGLARTLAAATAKLADLEPRVADAEAEHARASSALSAATAAAGAAELHATQSRALAEQSASALASAQGRIAQTEAELGGVRARVAALDALIAGADDGLARSARARGARLLGEGLEVDRDLVAAVSAALGAATAAYVVEPDAAVALAGRRGTLVLRTPRQRSESSSVAVIEAAVAAGGGRLSDAVRRDPQGEVTRLLERVIWIPDMAGAMALRPSLPTGWRIATRAGELVTDEGIVTLASGESLLDRRSERDAARAQMEDLEARAGDARAAFETAQKDAASATEAAQSAARDYDAARRALRQAEEAERVAARRLEQLLRERTWERAQVQRLTDELAGIDALAQRLRTDVDALTAAAATRVDEAERVARANATRTELRVRRDELRRERDERAARARAVEETRRRAEIGRAMDEGRLAELERDAAAVNARIAELTGRRDELARQIAVAGQSAAVAAATLDELLRQGSDERGRLVAAERAAIDARERLRAAESAARDSELQALEARLLLEQTREQLLLELATIGADGQRSLRSAAGLDPEPATDASDRAADDTTETQTIEELLDAVVARWRSDSAVETAREAPSAGRLAALRRRFNELGAGNPFAVEEYSELSDRLEALEAQRLDMESAIASTGELIGSLSAMINEQFRSTFAALEGAFERRFHELFGGGDAQLSLTAPDDISVTGVEIHARPPGKKRQPLSMLSGGERALTAVSLLLAMLEVRPVPFCVLDEVDAALDEANVSRFSSALRGLSQNTQFIVITHNRGTIEGADALYGVTIGDDAVSRVVSLKLPEPSAKSSQDRGANGHSTEEALVEAALA